METSAQRGGQRKKNPMLVKARECIKAKDMDEAKTLFEKVIESDPGKSAAYVGLSRIYLSDGDYDHASSLLDDANNCQDNNAEAWTLKARISIRKENLEKALEQYGEALAINPRMNSCRIRMGTLHLRLGQLKEAEQTLADAARYNPQSISAGVLLARALGRQDRVDDAIAIMQKVQNRHPASARVSNLIGRFNMSVDKLDEAIVAFNRAIELDAEESEHFVNLGNVYMKKGQPEQAVLAFKRGLKLAPDNARVKLSLSRAHIDSGDLDAAHILLQELSQGGSRLGQVHLMLAEIHMARDEYEEAVEEFQAALLHTPKLAESISDLAKLESMKGKDKTKAQAYSAAITKASQQLAADDSEESDSMNDDALVESELGDEENLARGE
jgi:Tfp pilus assembly protein PilF